MLKRFKKEYIALLILIIFVIGILFVYFYKPQTNIMKVAFLDVGQGDSIFIQAPNGVQMLVDGGRGGKVLSELSRLMPFGDKSIDIVIGTHPDADHIGGLVSVLENYEVENFVEPGAISNSKIYNTLENKIEEKKIKHILGRAGQRIILDNEKNIYFEILFPNQNVQNWETNDASIIGKLVYGESSVMLSGDSPISKELYLVNNKRADLDVDILKLGHHGSRTSSSIQFLQATSPEMTIISAGRDNSYGHPHKEVVDKLSVLHIPYLATYKEGTIICTSDAIKILCK
jgi:competence protein ComEC